MMHPATIFLGQRRRGDGLARAEEGSGEESARASTFCFGETFAGYKIEKYSHICYYNTVSKNKQQYYVINIWKVIH